MAPLPGPEDPAEIEDTRTWGEHARIKRKEEENPALLKDGDEDEAAETLEGIQQQTANELEQSGDGIKWANGELHGETDDNLTPYQD